MFQTEIAGFQLCSVLFLFFFRFCYVFVCLFVLLLLLFFKNIPSIAKIVYLWKHNLSFCNLNSFFTAISILQNYWQYCLLFPQSRQTSPGFTLMWLILTDWCNMSKTTCSVSSDIQTPRSGLKNEAQPSFLSPTSRCLDIGWNTERSFWFSFPNKP